MKLNKLFIGIMVAATANIALAAEPAPVIDVTRHSTSPSSISEQLANLERQLDARNKAQVNVQRQLDDLQNEVNELRGVTEQHTHQLTQVLERQRELYQELDRRVSEALKPANQAPSMPLTPTGAGVLPQVSYSNDLTENEAYDRAVNLVLRDKRYEEAIPEFKAFNQKYPNSTYAPNSHYWLGQLLFNKGELAEASKEFMVVINQFKDSSKRSDAMLKQGVVYQKQNKNPQAADIYKKLITEYPNSTAAQLAQTRLASIQ